MVAKIRAGQLPNTLLKPMWCLCVCLLVYISIKVLLIIYYQMEYGNSLSIVVVYE